MFARNILTTPIECAMSGQVHPITYIWLPTKEAYGILDISYFSSIVVGHCLYVNLKWEESGVPIDFASAILNFSNTFPRYCFCDNHNFFLNLSRIIWIAKIFLVGPKSFIAKALFNAYFNMLIMILSFPTINMELPYNNKITKLPLSFLLIYTQWSTFSLLTLWSSIEESNFLYHWRGACFNPFRLFFNLQTKFSLPFAMNPSSYSIYISSSKSPWGMLSWHLISQTLNLE